MPLFLLPILSAYSLTSFFILISAVGVDVVSYHIELIRLEGVEGFIDKMIKSKYLIGLAINKLRECATFNCRI